MSEELLNTTGAAPPKIEAATYKHFKEALPKLGGKYGEYYATALHCSEVPLLLYQPTPSQILFARFNEPSLFSSQEIAHKTFSRTKKDVNNNICIATKAFGIAAAKKSSS